MEARFRADDMRLVRRPNAGLWGAGALGTIFAWSALTSLFAGSMRHAPVLAAMLGAMPLAIMLMLVFAIVVAQTGWFVRERDGAIEVDDEAVRFRGKAIAKRRHLRDGFVVPQPSERPIVRLRTKWGSAIEVRVADEERGRALLRALGFDVSQTTASFRLMPRMFARPRALFGVIGAAMAAGMMTGAFVTRTGGHGSFVGPLMQLALLVSLVGGAILTRTRLVVGADGVLVRTGFGRKRFLRYEDIATVGTSTTGFIQRRWESLVLHLRSGELLELPVNQVRTVGVARMRAAIIAERIREAMESARRGDAATEAAMLSRGARTLEDWIIELRAIGVGANVDHRTAPILPERLWRIVEDPTAPPSARAGAAVALGPTLDDEGRARIRVAADATASPKLRVALGAATQADDAALGQALEEIEAEAEREKKSA